MIYMTCQLPNVWEDELHNIIQMSYGTSAPPNGQDADGILVVFAQMLSYDIHPNVLEVITDFPLYLQGLCHLVI